MATPAVPAVTAALQKSYVTYTAPIYAEAGHNYSSTVTTLESRALLSSSGVTGLRTWEGALHLGAYIASPSGKALLHGKTVLELGAGTGFLSIFCAKHVGAHYVLATDGDGGVVDDIEANIYLNGLEKSGRMESTVLKWGHSIVDELISHPEEERIYDLVLGADVVSPKPATSRTCLSSTNTLIITQSSDVEDLRCGRDPFTGRYSTRSL
jgi:predicted nicotinamide N-methyase